MKIIIYTLITFIIVYISCSIPPKSEEQENWEKKKEKELFISQTEDEAYYSGEKNDSIFFNLSFGMTQQDAEKQLNLMKLEQVVSNIYEHSGIVSMDFTINYEIYTNFGKAYCFFYNNRLHELQIDTTDQVNSKLIDLFVHKYGEYNYFAAIDGNYEYHWISGNRHISVTQLGESKNLLIQFRDTSKFINERNNILLKRYNLNAQTCES